MPLDVRSGMSDQVALRGSELSEVVLQQGVSELSGYRVRKILRFLECTAEYFAKQRILTVAIATS